MARPDHSAILGRDLGVLYRITDGRHEDLDLDTIPRNVRGNRVTDLVSVDGVDNAAQAVVHRVKTVRGELTDVGHPDYGSRHHELIGQPNNERNRNLVKLYILRALADEPRIEKVHKAEILPGAGPAWDQVTISLTLSFIGADAAHNLVVPDRKSVV